MILFPVMKGGNTLNAVDVPPPFPTTPAKFALVCMCDSVDILSVRVFGSDAESP